MTKEQIEKLHFNDENIYKIEKWQEYIKKGHFGDARDITNTYNEVFSDVYTKQSYTSCGSCLRSRCNQLYSALEEWREHNNNKNASTSDSNTPTIEDKEKDELVITEGETIVLEAPKKRKKKNEGQEKR